MDPVARRPDADGIKLRNQIKELVDRCLTRFCTGSQEDRSATANTLLFFNNFGRDICAHVITILRERALIHNNEDVCLGYDAAMPHIETNNTSLGRLGLTIEMVFEDFMRMYKRSRDQHTRPGGDKFPLHLADSVSVYRPKEAKFYFASQIWPDKGTEATSSPVEITGATKFTDPNERAKYERYIASAKPFDQEKLSYSRRKLVRTGTFLPYWAPRKCGNCSKALQEDEELMETRCLSTVTCAL
ncbi:uncharacterized protein N7483_000189 [Penicillium malachiteum]|uniref:uncharacterized protein n=1 Tax=Penicillium malachiteum TaxID=1324776 RepID=UPI0025466E66|nr:uncharacterized protein N7483_000189 [Penicillium malachiteum]KAJ5735064.1 hypothetical protein N7483_000189 [Penicillium malachiteum]